MSELFEIFKNLINPEFIIQYGGITLLILVIFAETGLFFGFFLPGDSLLFTAGLFCGTAYLDINILTLIILLILAAFLGDNIGYFFGNKVGQKLFKRKDSFLFKQKYLEMTKAFYQKHGGKAVIFGRFFPIIRTFAPILAGAAGVEFKKFTLYNIIGALLWIPSFTLAGYFLVRIIPNIQDYLHYIILGVIAASVAPVAIAFIKGRKNYYPKEF